MPEIVYCIDKSLSYQTNAFVLKVEQAEKEGFLYKFLESKGSVDPAFIQKLSNPQDTAFIKWLIQEDQKFPNKPSKNHSNTFFISSKESITALKYLLPLGRLFFQKKQIVINLFKKKELYFRIQSDAANKLLLSCHLKDAKEDFAIQECDFLCAGITPWFIKGISLELIDGEIKSSLLRQVYSNPEEINLQDLLALSEEDPDFPQIIYQGASRELLQQMQEPTPILVLKDRTGAFADLLMDYGKDQLISIKDPTKGKRNLDSEKSWERDLLETDFIRKDASSSQYYCPLDKVAKSLAFLLELGWKIRDWQGNLVLCHSNTTLCVENKNDNIHIKGKIKYGEFEADLTNIAGSFNRRDRFIQLGHGTVGLLPDNWEKEKLNSLLQESQIENDSLKISKSKFGLLSDLLTDAMQIQGDINWNRLKEGLKDFSHLSEEKPGINFSGELRPYQQKGVNWLHFLYRHSLHGLLADDMGLGKTVQVLAFLSLLDQQTPSSLIVVPTSLIFNWQREIERFLKNTPVYIHQGPLRATNASQLPSHGIILISYALLRLDDSIFSKVPFHCLILDEAQAIKNSRTQIYHAVKTINAQYRLSITGTPIENSLQELWSHFHFLIPDLLGTEEEFSSDILAAESDPRYLSRMKSKIRPFILRRKKEEVAKDLPERIEQTVWIEMTPAQRQLYDQFLTGFKGNLLKKVESDGVAKHRIEIFEAILRLRQLCCHPLLVSSQIDEGQTLESAKFEILLNDLDIAVAERKKVLVYSQFTSMLKVIANHLKQKNYQFAYLDGSTTDREKVVSQFQEDPETFLFLISLKAGGVGLNLTAADYVLLYDPWWNEAIENQAINRSHRIGRKDTVIAKRYIALESIEEKMMKLKSMKKTYSNHFLEEGLASELTLEDIRFLLEP